MTANKELIQKLLNKEIIEFSLKAKGAVNYAYYVKTNDGLEYIVKQERENKEFIPQNDLLIEAHVIEKLATPGLSLHIPKVSFISENPKMYGYKYIQGNTLKSLWEQLSEKEKIDICRNLGIFHAEIGQKFTKEICQSVNIKIDLSTDVHPEVARDYNLILADKDIPQEFKDLAIKARKLFDTTTDNTVFQFIHNDAHYENILIEDKKISGIIDFGNAEYGEVSKEFSRYIRDFPNHFQYIISSYEERSGLKLSNKRLICMSLINGLIEIVEDYKKGKESRVRAEHAVAIYQRLIDSL